VSEQRLIVIDDYESSDDALHEYVEGGIKAAMAAPVHEHGRMIGSLVVASRTPGRTYSCAEQDVLLAFAEHVSLTLPYADTDARHARPDRDRPEQGALTG
jgi:GAF domain-containing protein